VGLVLAALIIATATLATRADGFVYWTAKTANAIGRANLDGGNANLSFISGLNEPQAMAVGSGYLYWTTGLGSIGRANLETGDVNQNAFLGAFAQGLAVDDTYLYWTTTLSGNRIVRARLDGSSPPQTLMTIVFPATGVAVDSTPGTQHIYWAASSVGRIGRANLDGTSPNESLIIGASNPQGVAVNDMPNGDQHVYWTNAGSGRIGRANLDGTLANQDFIFAGSPQALAVDSAHVWWANGLRFDAIGRANLDSSSPDPTFLSTLYLPTGIAVDGRVAPGPGPSERPPTISTLTADVQSAGLPPGTQGSLVAKLEPAQRSVDAGNRQAACGKLGAFGNELRAQTKNKLDGDQAAGLAADATSIRQLLGCDAD
jgi:hypothetical protein